jgi:hypothetical protein
MPIYLQVVRQLSPTKSGVLLLPAVIGSLIGVIGFGPAVSITGYYTPLMLVTSVFTPIAAGLLTTLPVDATLATLILYQGLLGLACTIGFQAPVIAAQTVLAPGDVNMGIAAVQFAQNVGPALFIPVAQTIFSSRLAVDLAQLSPNLNATSLENMGFGDLKSQVGEKDLDLALKGYDKALTQTFFLAVILTCATFGGSAAMEWRSVKAKKS